MSIYGSVNGNGDYISEYVYPDAEYLLAEMKLRDDGGYISVYVPVDAVRYDPGLDMPESMTLG